MGQVQLFAAAVVAGVIALLIGFLAGDDYAGIAQAAGLAAVVLAIAGLVVATSRKT